ncbi:MAG: FliA/WhiG family RNA polymerase sigma factor [Planctomycetota bacterium]
MPNATAASTQATQPTAAAPQHATRSKRREALRERLRPVWEAYRASGDLDLRNQLVEAYYYLVRLMANRVAARLPRSIDVQDLRSAGGFGLIRAVEQFDIHNGTPFESYGALRVRGAILDALRAQDWVPRLVRNRASTWRTTVDGLRAELDREPMDHEVGERMGMTRAEAATLRRESNLTAVFTLSPQEESEDDPRMLRRLDALVDRGSEMPLEHLVAGDLARAIVRVLSRAEQTVIALYYEEGLTMKEIGHVMGISESRVCQIHTKCLRTLKEHLDEAGHGDVVPLAPTPRWART